jgi:glycosyltransferase involved in cell wall biosynthesis
MSSDDGIDPDSPPWMTIVIPARNEVGYLARTLRWLDLQRQREALDIEIVVVDGASTDDTLREAALADRLLRQDRTEISTIASARNMGSRASAAEMLLHTDADVYIPRLGALILALRSSFADPTVVAATTRIEPYPWEARLRDRIAHGIANRIIQWFASHGGWLGRGECQVVRRATFEAIGGYDDMIVVGEDSDLFHRLAKRGKVVYLRKHVVFHSTRRFRAIGYTRFLLLNAREAVSLLLRGRSVLDEWEIIR